MASSSYSNLAEIQSTLDTFKHNMEENAYLELCNKMKMLHETTKVFCKAKVVVPQFIQRKIKTADEDEVQGEDDYYFDIKNKIVTIILQLDMEQYEFRKKSIEKEGYVDMSTKFFKGVIDDVSIYRMYNLNYESCEMENHNLLFMHYDYVCLVDIELA